MVLYIDTFLSETPLHGAKDHFFPILQRINKIRETKTQYKFITKDQIFKYSLSSYAEYKWEKIYINFDSENEEYIETVTSYVRQNLPTAIINHSRSASRDEWIKNLSYVQGDNPWVFFSPNNDHPIVSTKQIEFDKLILLAEDFEKKHPSKIVSIRYSHFPEAWNSLRKWQSLYGGGYMKPKIIFENKLAYVVEYSQTSLDSIFIHRKQNLLKFFDLCTSKDRIVRLEDISPTVSLPLKNVVIIPKSEICRHYDSYVHTLNGGKDRFISETMVPVLFVPDGFFERKLKIRYGFDNYADGYVNINPTKTKYSFENKEFGADLLCYLNEIPYFWGKHIESISRNNCIKEYGRSMSTYLLHNPWYTGNVIKRTALLFKNYSRFSKVYTLAKNIKNFFR